MVRGLCRVSDGLDGGVEHLTTTNDDSDADAIASDREEYLSGHGEFPGRWYGTLF
jgi:hypothetical protein